MKKISLAKPKYVIPLIALPFSFLFNYLYLDIATPAEAKGTQQISLEEKEEINTNLPSANLKKKGIEDKFAAGLEEHKRHVDYSAIREIEEDENTKEYGSVYSEEEKRMLDSINESILTNKPKSGFMERVNQRQRQDRGSYASYQDKNRYSPSARPIKPESSYDREMRQFREQMRYVDSLSKAGSEKERPAPIKKRLAKAEIEKEKQKEVEPLEVTKVANSNSRYFNTVTDNPKEQFIKAILDEGLTVRSGGRIRVRLLDAIYVAGEEIPKGTYLFGTVTGFNEQRVVIDISSILLGNQILPVNLSIYDNDGLAGLYVPESKFRAFTKEVGGNATSGTSLSIDQQGADDATSMLFSMAEKVASTTTRAVGKAIKQNKAKLKYNTIVYLIDNKAQRK